MAVDPFKIGGETSEEEAERLRVSALWQKVMVLPEGRSVLGLILRDLGLFTPIVGERMAGRHEAAIILQEHMLSINAQLYMAILTERLTYEKLSDD